MTDLAGASSAVPREDSAAFMTQLEGTCRPGELQELQMMKMGCADFHLGVRGSDFGKT